MQQQQITYPDHRIQQYFFNPCLHGQYFTTTSFTPFGLIPQKPKPTWDNISKIIIQLVGASINQMEYSLSNFDCQVKNIGQKKLHLDTLQKKFNQKIEMLKKQKIKNQSLVNTISKMYKLWQNSFIEIMKGFYLNENKNFVEQQDICDKLRKKWTLYEIKQIQKKINQTENMTHLDYEVIAKRFNRSVVSVVAKVQKLHREKKQNKQRYEDISLQKKIIQVLKQYPSGLTKDAVIEKLQQNFQMDQQYKWTKSTGQLLSSLKSIKKVKGSFSLRARTLLFKSSSFRHRLRVCLHSLPQQSGDLPSIIQKYNYLFLNNTYHQLCQKQKKLIHSNILKTLLRYQEFDNSKQKTTYIYCQTQQIDSNDNSQIQQHTEQ